MSFSLVTLIALTTPLDQLLPPEAEESIMETPEVVEETPDFAKMTKKELLDYAEREEVTVYKSWTKTNIIHALQANA